MSEPRLFALVDVDGRPTVRWLAELSEDAAEALGNISVSALRGTTKAQPRNAAREAAARHYAAANYR